MGERQRGGISTFDSNISNPQNMLLIRQIPIILLIILGHTACGFSPDVQDIEEDILGLHTTASLSGHTSGTYKPPWQRL